MRDLPLDLDYITVTVPENADFAAVVKALASVPGCQPRPDAIGNLQSVYRIDHDGSVYTLIYPAAADPVAVKATFNATTPPPERSPLAEQRDIIAAGLANWPPDGNPVNRAALQAALALIDDKIGAAP